MKILTAAFFDDNYGDMLIRTCFHQLLKVVLQNLGIRDYALDEMYLKEPCDEQITSADVIVIPGGAMFGINYLGVADHIERILDLAEKNDIPVVFSSLGLNHMVDGDESDDRLRQILARPCIKAVSVRDSEEIFRRYAGEDAERIRPVCDPVVWAQDIYAQDIGDILQKKRERSTPVVGINVVRGGLFKDNGVDWTLTKEEEYLFELSQMLDRKGIDYRFFTNGQTWDCNTLRHFGSRYHIPAEKLIYSDTSREVVQTVAGFDAVVAIRMHAAIISYAMGVPSVNYVWNPKIPELYKKIGYPERAVMPQDWSAEKAAQMLDVMLAQKDYRPEHEILMTLYAYLYETFRSVFGSEEKAPAMYDYATVSEKLRGMAVPAKEDETDLRTKLKRASSRYYVLFRSDDKKKAEIRKLTKEKEELRREKSKLQAKLEATEDANDDLIQQLYRQKKELSTVREEKEIAQRELERMNNKFVVRTYRKVKGAIKR